MKKKWKIVIIVLSVTLIVTAVIVALYPTVSKVQTEQKIARAVESSKNGRYPKDGLYFWNHLAGLFGQRLWFIPTVKALRSKLKIDASKCSGCGTCADDTWKEMSLDLEDYGIWDGIYAYIEADAIDMQLPIYLGATDWNMSLGAAHLSNTSLPIGGKGSNCVLAGHTGYFGKTFFDNIIYLEKGDIVKIKNLWTTLEYKVIETETRVPTDGTRLFIDDNKDLLTFFTCIYNGRGTYDRYYVICERI